ncbi:MAG: imelysin family protein [Spirochaetota bacterium]
MNKLKYLYGPIILLLLTLSTCKQVGLEKEETDNTPTLALAAIALSQNTAASAADVVNTYANIAFANYSDSVTQATALQTAIYTLVGSDTSSDVDSPTSANFDAAKTAWLNARPSYLQTEVFRFTAGPIEEKLETRLPDAEIETLINAWPLDEAFIDCVITNTSTTAELTEAKLLSVNGSTTVTGCTTYTDTEKNIALGWHAVEYLLWGADSSSTTAGTASVSTLQGSTANSEQEKRRQYLRIATKLLVDHITLVKNRWDATQDSNYITSFKADPTTSISTIFTGLITFAKGEWGGERLKINTSKDQEDEHSCFSDNTKADFFYDAQGVINIFTGSYTNTAGEVTSGSGVTAISGSLASTLSTDLTESRDAFCLNVSGSTMILDSTTCPTATNSITSKFDSLSTEDQTDLTTLQTLIGVTIGNNLQTVADNNGISTNVSTKQAE